MDCTDLGKGIGNMRCLENVYHINTIQIWAKSLHRILFIASLILLSAYSYGAVNLVTTSTNVAPGGNPAIGTTFTLTTVVVNSTGSASGTYDLQLFGVPGIPNSASWNYANSTTGTCTPSVTDEFTCDSLGAGVTVTHTFNVTIGAPGGEFGVRANINTNCSGICSKNMPFNVGVVTPQVTLAFVTPTVFPEATGGTSNAVIQLTLDQTPNTDVSLQLVTDEGTALAGSDFTDISQTITWLSGASILSQTVNIPIVGDAFAEANETLSARVFDLTGLTAPTPSIAMTISDDDGVAVIPNVDLILSSVSVNEDVGSVIATIILASAPAAPVAVTIDASANTAVGSGGDYLFSEQQLIFSNTGPLSQTVTINITDDSVSESTEDFAVGLSNAQGVNISLATQLQTITILDDDVAVSVATPPKVSVSSQRDFSEDSGSAVLTFTRTGDLGDDLNFDVATLDQAPIKKGVSASSSATVGVDYSSTSLTVSWASGDASSKSISIPIIDDSIFEGDEDFRVDFKNLSSGASFDFTSPLTITITENEAKPAGEINFKDASYDVSEELSSITVTATRSGGSSGATSVTFESSDGSATAGVDYVGLSGSLSWVDGEEGDKTFTVSIIQDILTETTESFNLELKEVTGFSIIGSQDKTVVNIIDFKNADAPNISKNDISLTDFDGDGEVEVSLDVTDTLNSTSAINSVSWLESGGEIATGLKTTVILKVGTHSLQVLATNADGLQAAANFTVDVLALDPTQAKMLSETAGLNPTQGSVAVSLDSLCPRLSEFGQQNNLTTGQLNLRSRCENLRNPDISDNDIITAMDQIGGEEVEAILFTNTKFSGVQQNNIRNRFTQLRRGSKTIIDVSGINIRFDGGTLNGHTFADASRKAFGGAAGADDSETNGTQDESEIIVNSKLGIFMNGNVSYGERDPSKNNSGFKLDIQGITVGLDYRFTNNFIAGFAVGYSASDLDYADNGGSLGSDSTFYSAYTSLYNDKNIYWDSSITYADSEFDVLRRVQYQDASGRVNLSQQGNTNGEQILATMDFGWDINSGPWSFGPNGSLAYSDTSIDAFTEQGSSGLELQYSEQNNVTSTLGLGFHGSRVFLMEWGVLIAQLNTNFYREFKNNSNVIRASFVHDPFRDDTTRATPDMLIVSEIPDKSFFSLGLGLSAQFVNGLSGFIDYQTLLGVNNITSRELALGLRYEAKFW